jgi:hypothetical protein
MKVINNGDDVNGDNQLVVTMMVVEMSDDRRW